MIPAIIVEVVIGIIALYKIISLTMENNDLKNENDALKQKLAERFVKGLRD